MTIFKVLMLGVVLAGVFTRCASNQRSQAGSSPTISGYISTGAQTKF